MIEIRRGGFETNSSRTHSISILPEEDFQKFKNGELYMKTYPDEEFFTKEELLKFFREKEPDANLDDDEVFEKLLEDYEVRTYNNYGYDYETFETEYKTKSGDKIVAFGYYGDN